MIPVSSVGINKTESEITTLRGSLIPMVYTSLIEYPNPYNVDVALLFCILENLKLIQTYSAAELDRIINKYAETLIQNNFIRNCWKQIHGRITPREMLQRLKREKTIEQKSLARLSRNVDILENLIRGRVRYL